MRTKRRKAGLIAMGLVPVAVVAVALVLTAEASGEGTKSATAMSGAMTEATKSPRTVDSGFTFPISMSDGDWHKLLTANQFYILREQGTEPPFTGKYWNNHGSGTYYSAATGQPLFSSRDKFDSGTGWPSFTRPIDPGAVLLRVDNSHFMHRIEVIDSMSGSHLGHVFDDGPAPTGKRYCIDSGALIFVPTGGTPPATLKPKR